MSALTRRQRGVLRRRLMAIDIHMNHLSNAIERMSRDIGRQYAYTLEQRRANYATLSAATAAAVTVDEGLLSQSRVLDEHVLCMQRLRAMRRELICAMGRGDEPNTL